MENNNEQRTDKSGDGRKANRRFLSVFALGFPQLVNANVPRKSNIEPNHRTLNPAVNVISFPSPAPAAANLPFFPLYSQTQFH